MLEFNLVYIIFVKSSNILNYRRKIFPSSSLQQQCLQLHIYHKARLVKAIGNTAHSKIQCLKVLLSEVLFYSAAVVWFAITAFKSPRCLPSSR